jgi:hypothetical protein
MDRIASGPNRHWNRETVRCTTMSEQEQNKSPLDVGCVETSISRDQIVRAVREGHERV